MATLAMRAARPLDAGHPLHERRHRRDHGRVRRRRIEGRAGRSEVYRLVRRAQQAVMANALEATGQDMKEEACDERLAGQV